ncbi:hypothetical protein Pla110_19490 [Polystyrenella longa]|uniref:Uncharacterized protein n=1 Tax=Polystyrenella longa TaxID=2528007 RepID=A0A518CLX7_9PLAN|nr:hypothetical protein [Polystyrenella longa]QDU80225.1 hypothetical protein Pla110_19490 [Polystyrenella longa]
MSSDMLSVEGPLSARAVVLEWYLDEAADLASRSTFEPGLLKMPLNPVHWQQYVHWSRKLYSTWTRPTRQVAFSKSPVTACWPGTEPFCAEVIVHSLYQRVWHALLIRESRLVQEEQPEEAAKLINECLVDCEHLTQKLMHFEQVALRYLEFQPADTPLLKLHQLCRQWGDQAVELLLRDFLKASENKIAPPHESLVQMIGSRNEFRSPLEAIMPMELEINQLLQESQLQSQPRSHFHRALITACQRLCIPSQ